MYKNVASVEDWFFVHKATRDQDPPIVWRLAAWGCLNSTGEVVGLIGAFGNDHGKNGKTPHLVTVPPVPGEYLHLSQLTEIELSQIKKR
ncbi:MAG: hypothetical protein ACRYHA_07625 [Janthinobacterium lividum]